MDNENKKEGERKLEFKTTQKDRLEENSICFSVSIHIAQCRMNELNSTLIRVNDGSKSVGGKRQYWKLISSSFLFLISCFFPITTIGLRSPYPVENVKI